MGGAQGLQPGFSPFLFPRPRAIQADPLSVSPSVWIAHRSKLNEDGEAILDGREPVTTLEFVPGDLVLFFGARTPEELPYFGPLKKVPVSLLKQHLVYSRLPDSPKEYVQDRMRTESKTVGE